MNTSVSVIPTNLEYLEYRESYYKTISDSKYVRMG